MGWFPFTTGNYLDVPLEVRINGWFSLVFFRTYKWGIPWGYNPLILTIDPNFQRDIQVIVASESSYLGSHEKN